jgi:hypothetical protein
MTRNQRIEFAFVARELAVQVKCRLAQSHASFFHLGGIDVVPFDEIEERSVHALDRGGRRPKAQRDLLELPMPSELGDNRSRAAAIRVNIIKTTIRGSEKFTSRQKVLLGEQRRQQS